MMGFSAVGAHLVSQYLEQLTCEGVHPPIDAAYVWFRRANPGVRAAFADPPLAGQRPSRSAIAALACEDRVPLVRSAAAFAPAFRTGPRLGPYQKPARSRCLTPSSARRLGKTSRDVLWGKE